MFHISCLLQTKYSSSQFVRACSEKMLHTVETHQRWYAGCGSPEFQDAFSRLGKDWIPDEKVQVTLEKFVCALYGQGMCADVNSARYNLFCMGIVNDRLFPPTQDCLQQHTLRANYQAAIHRRCLQNEIDAPSPVGNGWELENGQLVFTWMTNAIAPDKLLSVITCKCKKTACGSDACTCRKNGLKCSEMCACYDCRNRPDQESKTVDSESEPSDTDSASECSSDTDNDDASVE